MRNCPICNQEVKPTFPNIAYLEERKLWTLDHFCHVSSLRIDACITIYGATREEVIQKWNGEYHAEEQTSESV